MCKYSRLICIKTLNYKHQARYIGKNINVKHKKMLKENENQNEITVANQIGKMLAFCFGF